MLESGLAFVLFKGLLGFGLPLAFALQQLWSLRREERRARAEAAKVAPLAARPVLDGAMPDRRAA